MLEFKHVHPLLPKPRSESPALATPPPATLLSQGGTAWSFAAAPGQAPCLSRAPSWPETPAADPPGEAQHLRDPSSQAPFPEGGAEPSALAWEHQCAPYSQLLGLVNGAPTPELGPSGDSTGSGKVTACS